MTKVVYFASTQRAEVIGLSPLPARARYISEVRYPVLAGRVRSPYGCLSLRTTVAIHYVRSAGYSNFVGTGASRRLHANLVLGPGSVSSTAFEYRTQRVPLARQAPCTPRLKTLPYKHTDMPVGVKLKERLIYRPICKCTDRDRLPASVSMRLVASSADAKYLVRQCYDDSDVVGFYYFNLIYPELEQARVLGHVYISGKL